MAKEQRKQRKGKLPAPPPENYDILVSCDYLRRSSPRYNASYASGWERFLASCPGLLKRLRA